jgi:glycosyltransferase involved in cell wall biosynthesis
MSAASPKVTVLMPVYNRRAFVGAAIESILAQDFSDFELLVIDDGSTDGSIEVLRSFQDSRIRAVYHERNLGIPVTRNHGLDLARGEYLAMLDSDDRADRARLGKQVHFLDHRPDIAVLGSWWTAQRDGHAPRPTGIMPIDADEVQARLLFHCALSQSTVMARTAVLRTYRYPEECAVSSDYALWVRLAVDARLANLPRFLVHRRMHAARVTYQAADLVRRTKLGIFTTQLDALGVPFTAPDVERHFLLLHLRSGDVAVPPDFLDWADHWLNGLAAANTRSRRYAEPTFTRVLGEVWLAVCWQSAASQGWSAWRKFWASRLSRQIPAVVTRHASAVVLRPDPSG